MSHQAPQHGHQHDDRFDFDTLYPRGDSRPQNGAQSYQPQSSVPRSARKIRPTGADSFWYVLGNIFFAAAYLAKVPMKKALVDYGLVPELTGAEQFWYVLMNVAFGAGYLAKVISSKAISELPQFAGARRANTDLVATRG
jgi:hypothetical protein